MAAEAPQTTAHTTASRARRIPRRRVDAQLPFSGSLYFAKDLLGDMPCFRLPSDDVPRHGKWGDIVIGPSVARRFWRGGRARLHVDRGPCA